MVTSDFRPKVKIPPFRACAMKNMQNNPYLWPNRRYFRVLKEIWIEEHDGDVRFYTGSGDMAVLCMRNASRHNYRNSSFVVDLAMGQIPRSTERISSLENLFLLSLFHIVIMLLILIGQFTLLFRQNGRNFRGDNSMGLILSLMSFTK